MSEFRPEPERDASPSEPQSPIAQRLEVVRQAHGLDTIKEFYEALGYDRELDPKEQVSYGAARSYHRNQDPPVRYLVRVSERFRISLDWLLTGRGEAGAQSADEGVAFDNHPGFKQAIIDEFPAAFIDDVRAAVVDVWMRYPVDHARTDVGQESKPSSERGSPDWRASLEGWTLGSVARLFNEPFRSLGVDASDVPIDRLAAYAFLFAEAIKTIAPRSNPLTTITLSQARLIGISRTHSRDARTIRPTDETGAPAGGQAQSAEDDWTVTESSNPAMPVGERLVIDSLEGPGRGGVGGRIKVSRPPHRSEDERSVVTPRMPEEQVAELVLRLTDHIRAEIERGLIPRDADDGDVQG